MDIYWFSLALGGAGLGAMGAIGLGHLTGGAHGAHGAHHGQHGHGHGGHAHGGHAHGGHGHAGPHTESTFGDLASRAAWSLLSPRVLFSLLVGFGATGLLVGRLVDLPAAALWGVALAGGIAFERLLVAPLWALLFRFGSRPAVTLDHALYDEGEAMSGFDARGQGLVALELDGQVLQVLATLCAGDRAAGVRVRAGDRLRVEDVDAARNRCVVTRIG